MRMPLTFGPQPVSGPLRYVPSAAAGGLGSGVSGAMSPKRPRAAANPQLGIPESGTQTSSSSGVGLAEDALRVGGALGKVSQSGSGLSSLLSLLLVVAVLANMLPWPSDSAVARR